MQRNLSGWVGMARRIRAFTLIGLTQLARIGFAYSIQSDYLWQL
jgi:hypothetical protein